ncbi:MAG: hypothetical protein QOJ50_2650 [Cryptosporangiaceae bacterium]|nr:hypothetical protein [Cryptosporangiaceae bacterium]
MVTVIERWMLRPDLAERGLQIMEEMDDLVGPSAHADPGWSGHAHFCRSLSTPNEFLVIYPWRSVEDHEQFRATEDRLLTGFNERYCASERHISYYDDLPVDVEDKHG